MAITATDILYKFSVAAAAGNTTAGTAAGSLGDQISTTQITDNSLNNLFDDVTGDENAASTVVDYRCIFVHNAHASLSWQSVVVWVSADVANGVDIAIGVDPAAASAIGQASAQAATIASETSAPAGVTFTNYASGSAVDVKARGLSVGTLAAGQCRAVWIRRTSANRAALNNDGSTLRFEGDTAA